jgi:hypothetical protein
MAVPLEVLNLQSAAGDGYVHLSWDAPYFDGGTEVIHYRLYRGDTSGGKEFYVEIGALLHYNDTSVINGITYYYQVSARNAVGEGPKSNEVNGTPNRPVNQIPICNVHYPKSEAVLSGTVEIYGSSSDADGTIQRVEIKIDNGSWIFVTGTTSWSYNLDTTDFTNSLHTINIRSYDGMNYSTEKSIDVEISNVEAEPQDKEENMLWLWMLILFIIIVVIIVALLVLKRKRPLEEEEDDDEFEEEVPPKPPKKAKITDLYEEGVEEEVEEGENEIDKLDLPGVDEED